MSLKYRPEIDGLRAVAVVSVILYHAGFVFSGITPFQGGFIGVDVFFVISGYLITSIILRETQEGGFSFSRFYERRARRILPALFTVMACSIPAAWMYMLPKAMKEYANSLLYSLSFISNIWFLNEDSYTAEPSALKPFLHTWSLSVEEQFYVIFPIVLMLAWKFARKYLVSLFVVGFLLSLQLAHYGSSNFPDATFYLLPTRGWELLAGAILAKLELNRKPVRRPFLDAIMPGLGLFLIADAVIFFDKYINHPSYITLLPIAGAMMFIWFAKRGELATEVLSSKPFVAIGLVSYSFYLWHFPIFAFARIQNSTPSDYDKVEHITLALVMATLTYFLIERPARKPNLVSRRKFVTTILIVLVTLGGVNMVILEKDGWPSRLGTVANLFENARGNFLSQNEIICANRPIENLCHFKTAKAKGHIINLGDSHANVAGFATLELARRYELNYTHSTQDGCPYIIGVSRWKDGKTLVECNSIYEEWRKYLLGLPPSIFIYYARLPLYLSGSTFDNQEGGLEVGENHAITVIGMDRPDNERVAHLIIKTIQELLDVGHTVVMVYPVPEVGWHVPRKIKAELYKFKVSEMEAAFSQIELTTSYPVYKKRVRESWAILDSLGNDKNLVRVFPDKIFCKEETQRCYTHNEEVLYYMDDDHVSPYGAELITGEIEKKLIASGALIPE